jgi:hypothetical protein
MPDDPPAKPLRGTVWRLDFDVSPEANLRFVSPEANLRFDADVRAGLRC